MSKYRLFTFWLESIFSDSRLIRQTKPTSVARSIIINNLKLAELIISKYFSPINIKIYVDSSLTNSELIGWHWVDSSNIILTIPNNELSKNIAIFNRLYSLEPIIRSFSESNRIIPHFSKIHMGDNPEGIGLLVFCGNRQDQIRIPDPDFLTSIGYAKIKKYFSENIIKWADRETKVFWRGATTGLISDQNWRDLPRIKLCCMANNDPDLIGLFDVGISNIVQFDRSVADEIKKIEIERPFVPIHNLLSYKYHIDIDGNSNAWSGLFQKLLSGGLIFKIGSEYDQWYYDRLIPWKHFIPVSSDMVDLVEKIRWAIQNDSIAENIASEGAHFAHQIDFQSEVDSAAKRWSNVVQNKLSDID